jgi:hypothetical protein
VYHQQVHLLHREGEFSRLTTPVIILKRIRSERMKGALTYVRLSACNSIETINLISMKLGIGENLILVHTGQVYH